MGEIFGWYDWLNMPHERILCISYPAVGFLVFFRTQDNAQSPKTQYT
jgi:hypothetical protein